jgi:hypothetical protein
MLLEIGEASAPVVQHEATPRFERADALKKSVFLIVSIWIFIKISHGKLILFEQKLEVAFR